MSRKYMNERWCIRCNRKGMTPFLRDNLRTIESGFVLDGYTRDTITVVDIGCGNGRNLQGLAERGYARLTGYDMCRDSQYAHSLTLGQEPLPEASGSADIVLANYIFMFLTAAETKHVMKEINRITHPGSVLVLELYPAKDSRITTDSAMVEMQRELEQALQGSGTGAPDMWERVRWRKGKCVLRRWRAEDK